MVSQKNYITLDIYTNYTEINKIEFGNHFLDTWLNAREDLCPEFFAETETCKRSEVAKIDIDSLKKKWIDKCQYFKRISKPKFTGMIYWNPYIESNFKKGKKYPVLLSIFFSITSKETYIIDMFKFLLPLFLSKYANINTNFSNNNKYQFIKEIEKSICYRYKGTYVGTHFPQLGMTIPQISWVNYFGDELVSIIGEEKFQTLKAHHVEKIYNGYFIMSYPSHKMINTPEANEEEERIMQHLGKDHFFDRNKVNAEDWI